jgi:hypothetical protein
VKKVKTILATGALALSLTTAASAQQLLLPPAPATQIERNLHNIATIFVYAENCAPHLDPDYHYKGKYEDGVQAYIKLEMNRYFAAGYRVQPYIDDVVQSAKAMGGAKFCKMGDEDVGIQNVIANFKAKLHADDPKPKGEKL